MFCLVIETSIFAYLLYIGTDQIEKENDCVINVCGSDIYDGYYYNMYENICYCFSGDEITHIEYLK